jgi:hypothetical protein
MGFGLVLDVVKSGLDLVMKGKKLKIEEREVVSEILLDISQILNSTVEKFKKNEFPHSHCQTLQILANNLHGTLKPHLDPGQAQILIESLGEASLVEREFAFRHEPETIQVLEIAAGSFKAWSLLIKSGGRN